MRYTKLTILLLVSAIQCGFSFRAFAQDVLERRVSLTAKKESLKSIIKKLNRLANVEFVYSSKANLQRQFVTVDFHDLKLESVLEKILWPMHLSFQLTGDHIVITSMRGEGDSDNLGSVAVPLNEGPTEWIEVSGYVRGKDGVTLPGVTVRAKGTEKTVHTDGNGKYRITANGTLLFSCIGYRSYEIKISNRSVIDVELMPLTQSLKEVVVLGYGLAEKGDISSAISSLVGESVSERPSALNIGVGLAGKVSGVNVMINSGSPEGNPSVKIRGTGSINSSNKPLYVIDGVVGADPDIIDPNIIASVDIYKDASSSAIYGSRGANGVIVITLKQGQKNTSDISFNNTVSIGTLQRKVSLLNANEALDMIRRQYEYVPDRLAPHLDPSASFTRKSDLFNSDGTPKYHTDWQKEATRTALSRLHSLTLSGGKDKFTVLANISVRKNEGILLNNNLKQLNAFLNLTWDIRPWFTVRTGINAGAVESNDVEINTLGLNAIREMYEFLPFMPVTYKDGTYSRKGDYPGEEDSENPVRLLKSIKNINGRISSLGNIAGTFHLVKHLDLTSSFSGQLRSVYQNYYSGSELRGVSETQGGIAQRTNNISGSWTNENYFSYQNDFSKHSLSAVAGASWYYYNTAETKAGAEGFFDDSFGYNSLQSGTVIETPVSYRTENQLNSFFSRVSYNYDKRYLLGVSLRADGSSRFGSHNKYSLFPAFSLGWRVSREKFFTDRFPSSDFKIRTSFGVVGNSEIENYATLARYNSSQVIFNKQKEAAVTLATLGNPDLKWERARQFDLGVDMAVLNGKLEFTADYYNKTNDDLLYEKQLPAASGYGTLYSNIGSIRNKGVEFSFRSSNIAAGSLLWDAGLNFSMNRSKVLDLNNDIIYTWGGRIMEGRPLNEFYGYVREGVWGTGEEAEAAKFGRKPGDVRYSDLNENGIKDAGDRRPLGNGMPRWEASLTNTISYKNFSLFFDLSAMYGNKLFNLTRYIMESPAPDVNGYKGVLKAWTPDNQNTLQPMLRLPVDHFSDNEPEDSYYVEDGSFLRMRNISLSYKLRNEWMKDRKIQNLTLRLNVENAFLVTGYKGYDPEAASFDGVFNQGVDFYQYPKPRTISLSINANF